MTTEKFEEIIRKLNAVGPYSISCGNEFGGYGKEMRIDGLEHPIIPLIYVHNVFGFSHCKTIYYRTNDLNALNIAKVYGQQTYCKLREM